MIGGFFSHPRINNCNRARKIGRYNYFASGIDQDRDFTRSKRVLRLREVRDFASHDTFNRKFTPIDGFGKGG